MDKYEISFYAIDINFIKEQLKETYEVTCSPLEASSGFATFLNRRSEMEMNLIGEGPG